MYNAAANITSSEKNPPPSQKKKTSVSHLVVAILEII